MRTEPVQVSATSRLRMTAYCLVLTAVAMAQSPAQVVGDTKFDLVVDPWRFLSRAGQMWDPGAAFGQIQNQAYGYFWPMGPFFGLGQLANLPDWVVQRLWWALLLCLAFVGMVRLCQRLELGRPWAQVLAAFAFALSPRMLTLLGATSVEVWPTALAPWVLLPLVAATQGRWSYRRGAAVSALVVATCGGVNAVAVSAVLPLGVLWILTREPGRGRWVLLGWWTGFTALATLWWVVPLLLMGAYSPPFLDYIESAAVTTAPTGLGDVLTGVSNWVAYVEPNLYRAGNLLATAPFLILDAAAVAGLGLAGICRGDNPHRRFLFWGFVAGLVLVGFGYTGQMHGWWGPERNALLDAELAAFRNLHKYDVVLRLVLTLGLAHFVSVFHARAPDRHTARQRVMVRATAVVAVVGVASPAVLGLVAPAGGIDEVPRYWARAADYLDRVSQDEVALEVPASSFGDYLWGRPHDDVLQPLAGSPWAVRNVVPLAQPGNVLFLEAVTEAVEAGRPSPGLARFLAANGVGHLVVRNDLDRPVTGTPDPVVLHQALDLSEGLTRVAGFGPRLGAPPYFFTDEGVRVVNARGVDARYQAVEVYRVAPRADVVSAWAQDRVPVVAGEPGSGLLLATDPRWRDALAPVQLLAGDAPRDAGAPGSQGPWVLTDELKRREKAFGAVRENESATLTPTQAPRLQAVRLNHRLYPDQRRWQTTAAWRGVAAVTASSSQGFADELPPIHRGSGPAAALDGDQATQWQSSRGVGARDQWWQVRFGQPTAVARVLLTLGRGGTPVERLVLSSGRRRVVVDAPPPGGSRLYRPGFAAAELLRVSATGPENDVTGVFTLAEVDVPGVQAHRYLRLPTPPSGTVADAVLLGRDQGTAGCVSVRTSLLCEDGLASTGEEGDVLARQVSPGGSGVYEAVLSASLRTGPDATEALMAALPVSVEATRASSEEVRASPLATVDGDPATTWVSPRAVEQAFLRMSWPRRVTLSAVRVQVAPGAPGARPQRLLLAWGDSEREVDLDEQGRAVLFPPIATAGLRIGLDDPQQAFSIVPRAVERLPVAVSEITFGGRGRIAPDPNVPLELGCGSGPELRVSGQVRRTALTGSLADLMARVENEVRVCGGDDLGLAATGNDVLAAPSALARPERLTLVRTDLDLDANEAGTGADGQVPVRAVRWDAEDRSVTVGARAGRTLLTVAENDNAGWSARVGDRVLTPQRVDGWKQGWWLPAGPAVAVRLDYEPGESYRPALLAGLVGVLVVLAAALAPGRRRRREPLDTSLGSRLEPVLLVLAAGLVAGWIGAALVVGVLLMFAVRPRGLESARQGWLSPVVGLTVLGAGGLLALGRRDALYDSPGSVQLLVVVAVALAFLALPAAGPLFFRRRAGRSRKR